MKPDDAFSIDDLHINVISDNGDGTETVMTLDEWSSNCLVEVNVITIEDKTLT